MSFSIEGHWLVEYVNEHTCGTGRDGYYGAHERGCGTVPVQDLAQMDGWAEHVAAIKAEAVADDRARIVGELTQLPTVRVKAWLSGWDSISLDDAIYATIRNTRSDRSGPNA